MIEFLKKMFSTEGEVSFGRVAALLSLVAVITWDSCFMWMAFNFNSHHLAPGQAPVDFLPDPGILAAQALFMTTFYGVTKYGEIQKKG